MSSNCSIDLGNYTYPFHYQYDRKSYSHLVFGSCIHCLLMSLFSCVCWCRRNSFDNCDSSFRVKFSHLFFSILRHSLCQHCSSWNHSSYMDYLFDLVSIEHTLSFFSLLLSVIDILMPMAVVGYLVRANWFPTNLASIYC